MPDKGIFKLKNIRMFIAFRFFFNARFYYPVFAVLFLDFGLTLEQFAFLNVVWAVTIVLLEVPSGALADVWGRRRLLVAAGWLMVVEMALLTFAPKGNPRLLFIIFLINRICSGAAEAAASGADESLAYDTLKAHGLEGRWGAVLARQMRLRAFGGVIALSVGAALYDPSFVEHICRLIGWDIVITQDVTLRLPLILTLLAALFTLVSTFRMREVESEPAGRDPSALGSQSLLSAFKLTLKAGTWILRTPFALTVLLVGVMFDNVIRLIITASSEYYRLIDIPEAAFGIIGAAMAGLGMLVPSLAQRLVEKRTPAFNFWLLSALALVGLIGIAQFIPWIGILPMMFCMVVMFMLNFFQSHYLNRITESKQRATVLSFKGLSLNLAYGISGMLFAFLLGALRMRIKSGHPQWAMPMVENHVFIASMGWLPWYYLVLFVIFVIFAGLHLKRVGEHRHIG